VLAAEEALIEAELLAIEPIDKVVVVVLED
jgi:hypothetical protein